MKMQFRFRKAANEIFYVAHRLSLAAERA
jgi:hypothetical protein